MKTAFYLQIIVDWITMGAVHTITLRNHSNSSGTYLKGGVVNTQKDHTLPFEPPLSCLSPQTAAT